MAFLIRTVALTADGREIVRDKRIERAQISVGRAAERDIHLTDLAVEPDHARIEKIDDRRIVVRSVGTLGFAVDGRTSQKVEIDSAVGAELRFGGHRITINREGDAICLTVTREEAVSDASEDKDEAAIFSLSSKMPSKRTVAWVFSLAVLAIFLAVPIISFAMRPNKDNRKIDEVVLDSTWSAGALSSAHHGLEENCESCHVDAFVSVRDETCKSCHDDAHDHAPAARLAVARGEPGLGGQFLQTVAHTFGKEDPGACVDCHREHEGGGKMAATAQQFCADCHADLDTRLTDTKLGNADDFGKSHPQFQPLVAVRPGSFDGTKPVFQRVSLDRNPKEQSGLKFPHDMHLSRSNGVARMAQRLGAEQGYGQALVCKDCHTPTADGVRFLPVDMEKDCQACHSLAFDTIGGTVRTLRHGDPDQVVADLAAFYRGTGPVMPLELGGNSRRRPGQYAQGQVYSAYFGETRVRPARAEQAVRQVFGKDGACGECHTVFAPGANGASGWEVMPVHQTARYLQNGWFSHDAHKQETCESCHAAGKSASSGDLLLPDLASCRDCHGGEGSKAEVATGCALCHNYHADDGAPWFVQQRVAQARSGGKAARP